MKGKLFKRVMSTALVSALFVGAMPMNSTAADNDTMIVVSIGDSYSSGEGIPAFYGQDKAWEDKIYDEDWIAHRSTKSWPGMLEIPGVSGKLRDYNIKQNNSSKCKWYFGAASGAETIHFKKENQRKDTYKRKSLFKTIKSTYYLPKQLDYVNKFKGDVDYVTMTLGGNDVKFEDIITTCATGSTYLHFGSGKLKIEKLFDSIWEGFDATRANIMEVYTDVQSAAGQQANIIVAGYPKLLDKTGKGVLISEKEATIVNQNVTKFNSRIQDIVNECKAQGMNIHFVDVEAEFDKDGGHQAYSDDAWINDIILLKQDEDLDQSGFGSAYSVHPNEKGAEAYARCVNAKIREIENSKNRKAAVKSAAPVPETTTVENSIDDIEESTAAVEEINEEIGVVASVDSEK